MTISDIAIFVIDASCKYDSDQKFISEQTQAPLLAFTGAVKQMIVLINKMDQVAWSKDVFEHITSELK